MCAGINAAQELVRDTGSLPVPPWLRDAHYKGAKALGHGLGYKYPHDFPDHYVLQRYLPDAVASAWLYKPGPMGYEAQIARHMNTIINNARRRDTAGGTESET